MPEELLRDAYANAFAAAAAKGCDSVALPALGAGVKQCRGLDAFREPSSTGVKGWDAAVTAAFGLEAAARAAGGLDDVAFVLGDDAFGAWARVAETLLGPPREASGDGLAWEVPDAGAGGDALPLLEVEEMRRPRARWATDAFVGPGFG